MKRIIMMLTVALVMAATMAASVMPAFAQGRGEGPQGVAAGPEGGNPGNLNCFQGRTVGENDLQPLPFAGQEPAGALITLQGVLFLPLRRLPSVCRTHPACPTRAPRPDRTNKEGPQSWRPFSFSLFAQLRGR